MKTSFRHLVALAALITSTGVAVAQDAAPTDPLRARTFHVAAQDNVAYLSVSAGLRIVDISNPGIPTDLATVILPQSASYAAVNGDVAYVAQGPAGVYLVDVSDKTAPDVISHVQTGGSAMCVAMQGNILAVADGSVGVMLVDVSNPADPRTTWTSRADGYVRGVRFYENRLYVCAGSSGVVVVDIDDGVGTIRSTVETAGDARDIDFYRKTAFVADGRFGVSVLDMGEGDSPYLASTRETEDLAHGVAFHKGYVFVADGLRGVASYRFERDEGLIHHKRLDTLDGYADKVTVHDRKLYVANDFRGMYVFDIKTPKTPRLLTE